MVGDMSGGGRHSIRVLLTFWPTVRPSASRPQSTTGNWNRGKQNRGWGWGWGGRLLYFLSSNNFFKQRSRYTALPKHKIIPDVVYALKIQANISHEPALQTMTSFLGCGANPAPLLTRGMTLRKYTHLPPPRHGMAGKSTSQREPCVWWTH